MAEPFNFWTVPTVPHMVATALLAIAVVAFHFCGAALAAVLAGDVREQMLRMCAALERAGFKAGLNRDGMARHMGISPTLYTRQIQLRDNAHPSWARMGLLPEDVLENVAVEMCDMHGRSRVITDAKLDALVHAVDMLRLAQSDTGSLTLDTRKAG